MAIRRLPSELIYNIITLFVSDYLCDVVLIPQTEVTPVPMHPLLHTSRNFRNLTIDILSYVFDKGLFDRDKMTVQNYIPFLTEIQSNIQRAHTAHLHTSINYDIPILRGFGKRGPRSIIKTLSTCHCLHILCNRFLECSINFEYPQFDALFVTSLPEFKEPPEPIMKCLVGPIYLEILKEELRLCRLWPIRLVAVSVDEIIEHIRDESYGANLSPKEVDWIDATQEYLVDTCRDTRSTAEALHIQIFLRTRAQTSATSPPMDIMGIFTMDQLRTMGFHDVMKTMRNIQIEPDSDSTRTMRSKRLKEFCEVVQQEVWHCLTRMEKFMFDTDRGHNDGRIEEPLI